MKYLLIFLLFIFMSCNDDDRYTSDIAYTKGFDINVTYTNGDTDLIHEEITTQGIIKVKLNTNSCMYFEDTNNGIIKYVFLQCGVRKFNVVSTITYGKAK